MHADWLRLVLGVSALAAIAILALSWAGVPQQRAVVTAVLRAAAQLSIVALALHGVFEAPWAAAAVVAVMLAIAVWTASRRLADLPGALGAVALACFAGSAVSIGLIVGTPILERNVRFWSRSAASSSAAR